MHGCAPVTENAERELLALLTRMAASLARLELKVCGERPVKPPPTAEELAEWKELNRELGRVTHSAPAGDGGGTPPSGGVHPEEFFRRKS